MEKEKEVAFNELVTLICHECIDKGFTLKEFDKAATLVREFYYDNAIPLKTRGTSPPA